MKLIYLACPYSGSKEVTEARMVSFCKAVAVLQKQGLFVISPLFMHYVLPYDSSLGNDWEFWKTYSRELIVRADELYILCIDGWDKSTGIKAEIEIARELNKPVVEIREV